MMIKRIRLHNIRSYADEEISFPEGSILLSGDIGAGKSTVLLAIEFALFGLERGVVEGAGLLRNGRDEGYVEAEFMIAGKTATIKRVLKRSSKTVAQSSASIAVDGVKKELTATELKSFVLNTLNYSASLLRKKNLIYRYTVYCPQEEMKKIVLESPDIRLDTLRKVFDIDKYERILGNCAIFSSAVKAKKKEKEAQISDLQFRKMQFGDKTAALEILMKKSEILSPSLSKLQRELFEIKTMLKQEKENLDKLARAKAKMASIDATIVEKKIQLRRFEQETLELKRDTGIIRSEINSCDLGDENELKKMIEDAEQEIQIGRDNEKIFEREIAALSARQASLANDSKKINSLKTCPVCQQEVTDEHRVKISSEIEAELEKINAFLKEKRPVLEELSIDIKNLEQQLKVFHEKEKRFSVINFKLSSLKEKEEKLAKLLRLASETAGSISELESSRKLESGMLESLKDFEQQYGITEIEFEKKQHQEKMLLVEKASVEQSMKDISCEIAELSREIEKKEKTLTSIGKLSELQDFLDKNFSSLVSLMEKQVMLKLNKEFNLLFRQWFASLIDDTGLEASVDIDFTPSVQQGSYDISYGYLSGGERTALALAYRLALNQVLNSVLSRINTKGFLILDEPTDGFSSEQLDKMRDVLNQLKASQLILVSHEEKMESFVKNVLHFSKESQISRVKHI